MKQATSHNVDTACGMDRQTDGVNPMYPIVYE